jgi:putative NADPH-quinone reductase
VNTLIIYCHPHTQSHNRRILDAVERGLKGSGTDYEIIDLHASGFEPRLRDVEYERMFITRSPGTEADVAALQAKVAAAKNLVFVYPVWWYTAPAVLKGFLDRVFTAGFAYRFRRLTWFMKAGGTIVSWLPGIRYLVQPLAAQALLKGRRAYIFRTYGGAPMGRRMFGNTTAFLENAVLRFCGITRIRIREVYSVNLPSFTAAREARHLRAVERIAAGIRNA